MPLALAESQERLPAESRKPQIVQVVLRLVVERGADAVSAQLIADAIGVTQPAIFRHFPTKEAIWLAVIDWLEDRLDEIYRAADSEGPALAVLSRMFLEHVRLVERHPALAKLVFSDHLRLQYPSLQKRFAKIHKAYQARVAGLIERAKAQGAVANAVRSADAVILFLCMIQGLGFQFAIARVSQALMPEAEHVLELYLRALTCRGDQTDKRHLRSRARKGRT
jgi:AcrR family transcriptional regulator